MRRFFRKKPGQSGQLKNSPTNNIISDKEITALTKIVDDNKSPTKKDREKFRNRVRAIVSKFNQEKTFSNAEKVQLLSLYMENGSFHKEHTQIAARNQAIKVIEQEG